METSHRSTSLRRRPLLLLCGLFLVLFYVTPLYKFVGTGIQNQWDFVSNKINTSVSFCERFPCFQQLWAKQPVTYLVDTHGCKILDLDPFDSSVKKFLKGKSKMRCRKSLISLTNETLVINKDVAKNWKFEGAQCCYRAVTRVTQPLKSYDKNADWGIKISDKCHHISRSKGTRIDVPYVKIECVNSKKLNVGVQFEAIVLPPSKLTNSTAEKAKKWDSNIKTSSNPTKFDETQPVSILIIGIDSISRLHMIRQLPESKKYLEDHDFIEMKGYTKVGENTFPNIMAAIGGMETYKYPCWQTKNDNMDNCPLLWKNFSQADYLTVLVEDAPGIAIFNYEKTGFVTQPTDYYLRPLMTAAHLHEKRGKGSGQMSCFGGTNPTDYMINYIKRFLAVTGKKYPYFLLSWFTSVSHDDFNGLQSEDKELRDLLKDAVENDAYGGNNTLILFISDHGYRFGNFRETFLGFYEESLPFFFIRMPPSLKSKFPNWYDRLKENSHHLTSPLDLYQTFKDILDLANLNDPSSKRRIVETKILSGENSTVETIVSDLDRNATFRRHYSFFEEIPRNRTCESSGIPQPFCMCGVTPEIDKKSDKSIELAKFVVSQVNNNQLEAVIRNGQCHPLKFSKVLYGRQLQPGEVWNNFGKLIKYQDYIVALEALPGKGHFEARIRVFHNGTQTVLNAASRINSYAGQSECVQDNILKNYCMCKKLVTEKKKQG